LILVTRYGKRNKNFLEKWILGVQVAARLIDFLTAENAD
jgi:hypothetical protein